LTFILRNGLIFLVYLRTTSMSWWWRSSVLYRLQIWKQKSTEQPQLVQNVAKDRSNRRDNFQLKRSKVRVGAKCAKLGGWLHIMLVLGRHLHVLSL